LVLDPTNIIGVGNFGIVYKGIAKGEEIAVKGPSVDCPKSTFKAFVAEICILCHLGSHENIVEFVGAYTEEMRKGL